MTLAALDGSTLALRPCIGIFTACGVCVYHLVSLTYLSTRGGPSCERSIGALHMRPSPRFAHCAAGPHWTVSSALRLPGCSTWLPAHLAANAVFSLWLWSLTTLSMWFSLSLAAVPFSSFAAGTPRPTRLRIPAALPFSPMSSGHRLWRASLSTACALAWADCASGYCCTQVAHIGSNLRV